MSKVGGNAQRYRVIETVWKYELVKIENRINRNKKNQENYENCKREEQKKY